MAILKKNAMEKWGLEHFSLMMNRLQILLGGKIYERGRMTDAAAAIERLSRKVKGWNSVAFIREVREKT